MAVFVLSLICGKVIWTQGRQNFEPNFFLTKRVGEHHGLERSTFGTHRVTGHRVTKTRSAKSPNKERLLIEGVSHHHFKPFRKCILRVDS